MSEQHDVVVVGAGIAGLVATLDLLEHGRDVLLLDRCKPEEVGGLAREAFGGMFMVDTPEQRRSGIEDSPAFAGEPPCNGCAERFIRTLKEQCLWARLYEDIEELRDAVIEFTERYNSRWLIERHGHMTPREAYTAAMGAKAA